MGEYSGNHPKYSRALTNMSGAYNKMGDPNHPVQQNKSVKLLPGQKFPGVGGKDPLDPAQIARQKPSYNRGYEHGYDPSSFEITLGKKVPKRDRLQNYKFDANPGDEDALPSFNLGRSLNYPSTDMGGTTAENTKSFRFYDHEHGLQTRPGSGRGSRKLNKANKTMSQIEALKASGGSDKKIARKIKKLDKTIEQIDPKGNVRKAANLHGHGGMYGYKNYRESL